MALLCVVQVISKSNIGITLLPLIPHLTSHTAPCKVSWRPGVTKLVLIERDAELVQWLMPRLRTILNPWLLPSLDIRIGDAFETLPLVRNADVALVDIFPNFGGAESRRQLAALRDGPFGANGGEVVGWGVT